MIPCSGRIVLGTRLFLRNLFCLLAAGGEGGSDAACGVSCRQTTYLSRASASIDTCCGIFCFVVVAFFVVVTSLTPPFLSVISPFGEGE